MLAGQSNSAPRQPATSDVSSSARVTRLALWVLNQGFVFVQPGRPLLGCRRHKGVRRVRYDYGRPKPPRRRLRYLICA